MFHLEAVEPLSIDTDDGTLGDKCGGVYLVYQSEDNARLATLCQDEKHLHLTTRIKPLCVDNRTTAMGVFVDAFAYFLVLIGDNEELNGTAHGVDHLVYTISRDEQYYITVDNLFPIFQYQITGSDDNHITYQNNLAERYITVLVDNGGNDIRATGATVGWQSHTHATTTECRADDACHKRLVAQQMHPHRAMPEQGQRDGKDYDGIEGLDAKLHTQQTKCKNHQYGIDAKIGILHRQADAPEEDGRYARHTTSSDVIGQQKDGPSYAIGQHGYRNQHVITHFLEKAFLF